MSEAIDTVETEGAQGELSLRDTLSNAFNAEPAPEPVVERARDDQGRFAAKPEGVEASAAQTIPDQPVAPTLEAPQEPIRPPASWSAPAKAKFAALDPEVQAEVLKREKDVTKGFEERATELKKYDWVESVFGPIQDRLTMNGQSPESYVRALQAADEALQGPNKLQAIQEIARMYGVDLRQFSQPTEAGQQPMQAQLDPQYAALMQEMQRLSQIVTQQQTDAQHSAQAQQQNEIDVFANDPAHLYFENVRPLMATFLRSGQAQDLKSAYEQACWADPAVRELMLQDRASKDAEQARQAASAKVTAARGAGISVAGSPVPGASAPSGPPLSIGESLREAFAGRLN